MVISHCNKYHRSQQKHKCAGNTKSKVNKMRHTGKHRSVAFTENRGKQSGIGCKYVKALQIKHIANCKHIKHMQMGKKELQAKQSCKPALPKTMFSRRLWGGNHRLRMIQFVKQYIDNNCRIYFWLYIFL